MEDYSVLFSYFEKINQRELNAAEKVEINAEFNIETFKKKQLIFSSGDTNTRHYYIKKGLLRLYIIDQNGKEFNILFAREKQWIGDLGTPAATPFYLDALENSIVYSINEARFNLINGRYMNLVENIRRSYVFLQQRLVSIISKTAEENYEALCENNPDLINRLAQYHISSYLGVTPVFLSKILSKRARKKDK